MQLAGKREAFTKSTPGHLCSNLWHSPPVVWASALGQTLSDPSKSSLHPLKQYSVPFKVGN